MMVSIVIPWIRQKKVQRCIEAARTNAGIPEDQYEIITEEDTERIGCPRMVGKLVGRSRGQMVVFLGDDVIVQPGWLTEALKAMALLPDGWGLVGLNDQFNGPQLATHWMADKRLLPLVGGEFFHTGYRHCFSDNELVCRCIELGRYIWAREARIEHDHPMLRGEPLEGTDYEFPYCEKNFLHDQDLFFRRQRNGWR
jgi:hypothetical protein